MEVKFYLGIDWGKRKIGLALADNQNRLATPFMVAKSLEEVLAIIRQEGIDELVLGKPISLGGEDKKFTVGFSTFVAALGSRSGLPINLVDERLSTKAANKLSGGKKQKAKEDAIAAMIILQSYLDNL